MTDQPDHSNRAERLMALGIAAFREEKYLEAAAKFSELTELEPDNADAFSNLGQAARALDDPSRAMAAFAQAIHLRPDFPEAHLNLGLLAASGNDYSKALSHYASALASRPDYPEAYFNRGVALTEMGETDEAIGAYRQAIRIKPSYGRAMVNLANLYLESGDLTAAAACFNDAMSLDLSRAAALNGLGNLHRVQGRLDEAVGAYDEAIGLEPTLTEPRWNRSLIALARGDFAGGWDDYRYRPSADREIFPVPTERFPDDIAARWFVLAAEQGLGDELFFLRFAATLKQRGAFIAYRPDPKIAEICQRIDSVDRILLPDEEADYSVADLPYFLEAEDVPLPVTLSPLEETETILEKTLPMFGQPPYLGVTWRAGLKQTGSLFKEIPLEELGAALGHWPGTIISLQREPLDGEAKRLSDVSGKHVGDLSPLNDNMETMLSLLNLLDDYVAVSNTNAHMRAGLGKPARILVTNPAEYRWMAKGQRSPWFPDFELYRQSPDGDWSQALTDLGKDLSA